MSDINKRLDSALEAVKALPIVYRERALVSLQTLAMEWEQRTVTRLDDRRRRRWAELNVEISRRLNDLREALRTHRR
jgi:hypothetical protein